MLFFLLKVKVKVIQSCPTLWDLRHHGLYCPWKSQSRILEWVAFRFSRGSSQPRDRNQVFRIAVGGGGGWGGGAGGGAWGGEILYQLSRKGSPRIQEWVAYPFSSGSSPPRNQTQVSCIAGGFFTNWAIRESWRTILKLLCLFLGTSAFFCGDSKITISLNKHWIYYSKFKWKINYCCIFSA